MNDDGRELPGATGTTGNPTELQEKVADLTASNRQLKRKIFDLYTIFEISRNFNAVLDYSVLLDTFILTSLAQVGASKAAIFLRSGAQAEHLTMVAKRGTGRFPSGEEHFRSESPLAEYLCKLNRPVVTGALIRDIASDEEKELLKIFDPGLVVPLIYQNSLRGIFVICEKISQRDFKMDDIEFLSILGNQISVAIENARLYESERLTSQQLRATQQQLVQAERLAALGEMSAKVAHEINNPLGIIKNYLLLFRRATQDRAEAHSYTDIVSQEIDRIAGIVRQLLDFHRPDGAVFKQIQLSTIIDEVLELMQGQIEKAGLSLIKNYPPECPPIQGSAENLKQVFMNLIINACDAMGKEGGTLTIDLKCGDGQVSVRFNDTGPGIAPEHVPHIFEPFFTTKDPGQGTGLGLSVCYGIIKKHNGTITYRNTASGGLFEIQLPTADGDRASE